MVPIAEETGHIVVFGETVLRQAGSDLALWHQPGYDALSVAVNVSNRQLHHKGFTPLVEQIMVGAKLPFNIEQCTCLRKLDCDSFLGFYFSRPEPFEQCMPYLSAETLVQKQHVG
jgi:EAL domain-containing protein (putative c-di-GMP-specific phosphodiesterase class I)